MALTASHVAGLGFGILTPLLLGRYLPEETFGTYRQVMLILWFVGFAGSFGMDQGLFYFVKRRPDRAAQYSLGCTLANVVLGLLIGGAIALFGDRLATFMNNPPLAQASLWLGLYVFSTLPGQHLAAYLVIQDRIGGALILNILNAAALALAAIGGLLGVGSMNAVLMVMTAWSLAKLCVLFYVNRSHLAAIKPGSLGESLRAQIKYSAPLGLSNLLAISLRLDRIMVSAFFPVRDFARYSVGCFDLPVVPQAVNNLHDLMSIEMAAADASGRRSEILRLWLDTVRKITLFVVPIVVFASLHATPIMRLLFSEKYADSGPIFRWFVFLIMFTSIDPEMIFRVAAKTRLGLLLDIGSTILTACCIWGGIRLYGLEGAIYGKVVAQVLVLCSRLKATSGIIGADMRAMIPWRHVVSVGTFALAAAGVARFVAMGRIGYQVVDLLVSGVVFTMLYATFVFATNVVTTDERRYLVGLVGRLMARTGKA